MFPFQTVIQVAVRSVHVLLESIVDFPHSAKLGRENTPRISSANSGTFKINVPQVMQLRDGKHELSGPNMDGAETQHYAVHPGPQQHCARFVIPSHGSRILLEATLKRVIIGTLR